MISTVTGYVQIDSCGNLLWNTFVEGDDHAGDLCWKCVTIMYTTTTTTSTTTTTTSSSTTTTTTTAAPTTTTTTTSTSSTSTTSTTSTSTTTTTTTSSTTTTTTTAVPDIDATVTLQLNGDANMAGILVTDVDVNATSYDLDPDLSDGNSRGIVVTGDTSYTITAYIDETGAANAAYVASNIRILIKDSVFGGTIVDTSLSGYTSGTQIEFTTTSLNTTNYVIYVTGP